MLQRRESKNAITDGLHLRAGGSEVPNSLTEADLQEFAVYVPQSWLSEGDYALSEDLLIKIHKRIAALSELMVRYLEG